MVVLFCWVNAQSQILQKVLATNTKYNKLIIKYEGVNEGTCRSSEYNVWHRISWPILCIYRFHFSLNRGIYKWENLLYSMKWMISNRCSVKQILFYSRKNLRKGRLHFKGIGGGLGVFWHVKLKLKCSLRLIRCFLRN